MILENFYFFHTRALSRLNQVFFEGWGNRGLSEVDYLTEWSVIEEILPIADGSFQEFAFTGLTLEVGVGWIESGK